jgi:hypothetical protein
MQFRHCKRSEAIQRRTLCVTLPVFLDCFASLAMTQGVLKAVCKIMPHVGPYKSLFEKILMVSKK